jgi:predicted ribosomally synthesized peptide with nif11-like leader
MEKSLADLKKDPVVMAKLKAATDAQDFVKRARAEGYDISLADITVIPNDAQSVSEPGALSDEQLAQVAGGQRQIWGPTRTTFTFGTSCCWGSPWW